MKYFLIKVLALLTVYLYDIDDLIEYKVRKEINKINVYVGRLSIKIYASDPFVDINALKS